MKLFFTYIFLMCHLIALAQINIIQKLENQNIGPHDYDPKTNTLTFEAGKDSLNTAAVWFSFGVTGMDQSKPLTLVLRSEKFVHVPNFMAVSANNVDYVRIKTSKFEETACSIKVAPMGDTMYIATGYPYTYTRLENLIEELSQSRDMSVEVIERTKNHLDVCLLTVDFKRFKNREKKQIWILCRQHAFESTASYVMEGMLRYLLGGKCDKNVRKNFVFKIVPMVDVESVFSGQSGRMAKPKDFNRDWENPTRRTIKIIENLIDSTAQVYDYHTFWDLHGNYPGGYLNYSFAYFDLYGSGAHETILRRYWDGFGKLAHFKPLNISDVLFSYDGTPADTWNKDHYPTLRISSTLEMDWNTDPNGRPWTDEDYLKIGEWMVKAMGNGY